MSEVPKSVFRKWISEGCNDQAVGVYGTSVEKLSRLLQTGEVPWNQPNPHRERMLPYQSDLLRHGGYLYHASAFPERIRSYDSGLAQTIEEEAGTEFTTIEWMTEISARYAYKSALVDGFCRKTGIYLYSHALVTTMAAVLCPSFLRREQRRLKRPVNFEDPERGMLMIGTMQA